MNPTERRAYTSKAKESGPVSQTSSTSSISYVQSGVSGIPESIIVSSVCQSTEAAANEKSYRWLPTRQHCTGSIGNNAKTTCGDRVQER